MRQGITCINVYFKTMHIVPVRITKIVHTVYEYLPITVFALK